MNKKYYYPQYERKILCRFLFQILLKLENNFQYNVLCEEYNMMNQIY